MNENMDQPRIPETLPNRFDTCETTLRKQYKRWEDTRRSANKVNTNQEIWDEATKMEYGKIKSKENDAKEVIEQTSSKTEVFTGSIKRQLGKDQIDLDILNNDIDKTETTPRKSWITPAMINKMEERRKEKPQTSKNTEAQ